MSLNPRQQRFVDAYLVSGNATEAAKEAGYSERSAYSQGHELLKHPEVAAELARRQQEAADRADASAERTLHTLACVAYADPADVLAWDGETLRLRPFSEMSADVRAAIAQVRVTKQSFTVRFHDKIRALELLGKAQGVFREDGLLDGPIEVRLVWPEDASE